MISNRTRLSLLAALCLTFAAGCGEKPAENAADEAAADKATPQKDGEKATEKGSEAAAEAKGDLAGQKVVIYSGRGAVLVEPLFKKFTEETGIQVEVRYGKSTQDLANMLATEGKSSTADVFFAQDSGHLGVLAKAGFFDALPEALLNQVHPQYRDPEGKWVGTSGRARVLVYNPEKVKPEDLPKSLKGLADPKWKGRLGWAPTNGSFQAHVSALRHLWGEEETQKWLAAVKANEPARYPKNSPQVKAASSGEIDVGWVNHYYLHKLKSSDPTLKAANYSFEAGDAGNVMMVAGVGVVTHSAHKDAAMALVRYLISPAAQQYFVDEVYEYPTRPGAPTHPEVAPLTEKLVTVDQRHLVDLEKTLAMLRDLGLN